MIYVYHSEIATIYTNYNLKPQPLQNFAIGRKARLQFGQTFDAWIGAAGCMA
jgi:hypothetical protein